MILAQSPSFAFNLHVPPMQFPRSVDLSMHDWIEFRVRAAQPYTYLASVRTEQLTGGDVSGWVSDKFLCLRLYL